MNISRRYPWMLWPDSICPSFLPNPILPRVQGDHYWKIEVDFENTENNFSTVKDVFCFVPKCTSLSIFENRLFKGLGYDNGSNRQCQSTRDHPDEWGRREQRDTVSRSEWQ